MVFFSCDGCAEMLKKSQVDGHAARCRRCASVSCVDCSVSFFGDDFRKHTSCVTEVERYEKRAPKKNGKVPPQQLWMDLITSSIATAPSHLKSHIRAMSTLDNVPRKEKPFYNFTANSLNLRGKSGEATVSEIWKYLNDRRGKPASMSPKSQPIEDDVHVIDASEEARSKPADRAISPNGPRSGVMETPLAAGTSDRANCDGASSDLKVTQSKSSMKKSVINRKVVKRKMIQTLKEAKAHSLTLKLLRKSVQKECPGNERSLIKDLVQQNLDRGKHFLLDGKTVTLKID